MRVLILGVNGFIGHHLSKRILATTNWEIYGIDIACYRLSNEITNPRFRFIEGDITLNKEWVEGRIKDCDIVLPLVAIATPAVYVTDPLRVFELDFEANLPIVRAAVRHNKRLLFPSSSEVYGMSGDAEFDAETTRLVYGPINKTRWIYACAKQMMDRVIFAYGQQHGLRFTLFRPFNWIGPGLDRLDATKEGSSRVVTQFLGQIMRGEPLYLVDGGQQRRCFTAINDGIDALMRIIENPHGIADGKIYNIGRPENDFSIAELADRMLNIGMEFTEFREIISSVRICEVGGLEFYGPGYEDATRRAPNIDNIRRDLGWCPTTSLDDSLREIFRSYRHLLALKGNGATLGPVKVDTSRNPNVRWA